MDLLTAGRPVVTVVTEAFYSLAHAESRAWGWDLPLARIEHPLGGLRADQLSSRASAVVSFVERYAGRVVDDAEDKEDTYTSEPIISAPVDPLLFYEFIQAQGWGDGFPLIHPTQERVRNMLASAHIAADAPLGQIPPANLRVTAQDVASNAVMAGCPDDAIVVVIGALTAALNERFNLLSIQATTHPCGVAVIVSGPVARDLGMNAGASLYGHGNRVNASIGRAVRLALQNLGRAWPGSVDKSTQGHPAKYSYCFAENVEESPWPAHHVERGFAPSDSTVTVLAGEGPHNVHDPASRSAESFAQYLAGSMTHCGHNNLYHQGDLFVVLGPEHANMVADDGWSRRRLRDELFERARVPAKALGSEPLQHFTERWPRVERIDLERGYLTVVDSPEEINIAVAGGPGKHSSWIPTFGLNTRSATVKLAGKGS